jgi:hypothetical protein
MFIPDLLGFKLGFILPKNQEKMKTVKKKMGLLGTSPSPKEIRGRGRKQYFS